MENNKDVFLGLHDFLERMRHPSAADFVKSIKRFIVSFLNNDPAPERDSTAVQEFFSNMEAAFRAHPLWAGCSEEELDSAGEGLEKYVMTKLFTRAFASLPDDVEIDNRLSEKMALIQQFIHPENLDIKPTFQNETSWLPAQKELQKINMYKAPRDKLVCILNCCKVINNLLLNASIASNENPPGADEFLPVLIYVTIKANPPQLHSNLLYIQRYRCQSRLVAEAAYFFTNLLSAESFISNIDAKALSMDETEFEKNMESAQALLSGLSTNSGGLSNHAEYIAGAEPLEPKHHTFNSKKENDPAIQLESSETKFGNMEVQYTKDQSLITKIPSLPELESRGTTTLLKEDQVSQVFQEYPYLFAHVGDLTLNDVEDLLNNYKKLVFNYVNLTKGLTVSSSSRPLSNTQSQPPHHGETVKEPEDTTAIEPNDKPEKDTDRTDNGSDRVTLFEEENSESKLPQDEMVIPQDRVDDQIS